MKLKWLKSAEGAAMRDPLAEPGHATFARVVREIQAEMVAIHANRDDRICELLAEGKPPQRVADLLSVPVGRVWELRRSVRRPT
jgi:hypothetical protein